MGAKWKELTDEEKLPYEEKAREAKEQYKIDLAKYYEEHPEAKAEFGTPAKETKAKKKAKTDGVRKPQSAYMHYSAAKREEVKVCPRTHVPMSWLSFDHSRSGGLLNGCGTDSHGLLW